jgi:hypothetical protein
MVLIRLGMLVEELRLRRNFDRVRHFAEHTQTI